MAEHELKILPIYFEAVALGIKTFEVRKDDRGFQAGDRLRLLEYENGEYTGRGIIVQVTYVLRDPEFCKEGYCIMNIKYSGGRIWSKQIAAKYNYTLNCSPEEKQKIFKEMKMKQDPYKEPETIKLQPVKHGRWIGIYEYCEKNGYVPSGMGIYYWCSECDKAEQKTSDFCPNCGARMDGDTE